MGILQKRLVGSELWVGSEEWTSMTALKWYLSLPLPPRVTFFKGQRHPCKDSADSLGVPGKPSPESPQ